MLKSTLQHLYDAVAAAFGSLPDTEALDRAVQLAVAWQNMVCQLLGRGTSALASSIRLLWLRAVARMPLPLESDWLLDALLFSRNCGLMGWLEDLENQRLAQETRARVRGLVGTLWCTTSRFIQAFARDERDVVDLLHDSRLLCNWAPALRLAGCFDDVKDVCGGKEHDGIANSCFSSFCDNNRF